MDFKLGSKVGNTTFEDAIIRDCVKVVALAIMSKSNLNNVWWIDTIVGLICVSAVL